MLGVGVENELRFGVDFFCVDRYSAFVGELDDSEPSLV